MMYARTYKASYYSTYYTGLYVQNDITIDSAWFKCSGSDHLDPGRGSYYAAYYEDYVPRGKPYTLPSPRMCNFTPPDGEEFDTWDKGDPGAQITVSGTTTVTALWKPVPELIFTEDSSALVGGTLSLDLDAMLDESYMMRTAFEEDSLQIVWFSGGTSVLGNESSLNITQDMLHETITCSMTEARQGYTVWIQVFPDCGYVLDELYYEAGPGGRSPIYSQSFWMPARNITVCATFKLYREDVTNILFLPNGLTALEDEAFAGVAAQGVRIPSSVMTIQGDPFADSSVKCVFGYGGSAAQVFADLHGYDFVDITPYYVTEGV